MLLKLEAPTRERERERESRPLRGFVKLLLAFFVLSFCFLQIRSPVFATSLDTGIASFWKLDEVSGTREDIVGTGCGGSGCDLTDNNTVTQAVGKIGNAGQFTLANSEYLSHADHADLSTGDIDFTVSAWVYADSLPGTGSFPGIVSKDAAGTREYQLIYYASLQRFTFHAYGSSDTEIGRATADNLGAPSTGQWYFIVAWHDSTANTINIQVNNGTVNSTATTGTPQDDTAAFEIGRDYSNRYWDGRIDGVGFWKRTLTTSERTALYNSGNGDEYPFTVPVESTPPSIQNRMVSKPTSDSVTVLVKTDISTDVTIDYGLTNSYGSTTATSTNQTHHEIAISSLSPSTTYHYRVTAAENGNASNTTSTSDSTFKTQLGTGNSFSFVVISDNQGHDYSESVTQIQTINPDLIISAGDNIKGTNFTPGSFANYVSHWQSEVFDYIQDLSDHIPFFYALGNHDDALNGLYSDGIAAFEQEVSNPTSVSGGEEYYSFDWGDAHFAVLNGTYNGGGSDGTIDSTQLTWLQNDLSSTSKKWKFVICHYLIYGEDAASPWRLSNYSEVATVLQNNSAIAWINGHRHMYNRYVKNSIFYISNPNTSDTLIGNDPYANSGGDAGTIANATQYLGFTKVSVTSSRVSMIVYQKDGTVIDSFDLVPTNFELSTPSNSGYTNDSTPTLSWNASSDNASGLSKYQLYVDSSLTQDNISSSATNVDAPIVLSDGVHTWYLKAVNNAGWSTQSTSTYTINVDTSSPTGSISVNSGNSYTTSRSVTLTISASSASQMMISENSDFSGASWETYSTSKSYTLSASDGTKTIYIKFKDEASNESSSYSTSITYDATAPVSFDLDSPGDNSYTNSERQTFKWKATTDATAGLSKYVLEIDNPSIGSSQTSGDFIIDNIPTNRTTDYETNKYTIHYENFSDSDSTNNYISVYTKSHNEWGSSENDGKLKEGRVNWKIKAVDNAGNEKSSSRTLFVDRTSPSVAFTQINSTPYTTNNFSTTDKTPTIFGKITDSLSGGDSSQTQDENGPKVASAPKEVNIKVEKKEGLTYKLVTMYKINMDDPYYSCDPDKIIDNSKQTCDKYLPFEYTPKENLEHGTYKITLFGKDKADNTSSETSFTLNITTLAQITSPEEKKIIEEGIKEVPKEDQEKVKEELEITKPAEILKPNVLEKASQGIAKIGQSAIQGAGKLVTTIFTGIGNGTRFVFNAVGSNLAFIGNTIGNGYNALANHAPGATKNILVAIRTNINNAVNGTRNGIANIAFVVGEKTDDISHGVGTAIIKIGYLFVPEPTKIFNVTAIALSPTLARITWETNHPANGKVNWGYDDGIYEFEDQKDKRTSKHEFVLENLKPDTEYHYEVMSQNRNYVYDANRKFKTPAK